MINRLNGASPPDGVTDPVRPGNSASVEKAPSATTGTARTVPEQVALSQEARLAQQVTQAAQASDGVSNERVLLIRKFINSGQYTVSSTAIARAVAKVAWMMRK